MKLLLVSLLALPLVANAEVTNTVKEIRGIGFVQKTKYPAVAGEKFSSYYGLRRPLSASRLANITLAMGRADGKVVHSKWHSGKTLRELSESGELQSMLGEIIFLVYENGKTIHQDSIKITQTLVDAMEIVRQDEMLINKLSPVKRVSADLKQLEIFRARAHTSVGIRAIFSKSDTTNVRILLKGIDHSVAKLKKMEENQVCEDIGSISTSYPYLPVISEDFSSFSPYMESSEDDIRAAIETSKKCSPSQK